MRPAASVHFTLAILVASANGHLGSNRLDCQTLAKVFEAGSTRDLPQPIRDQIHDLVRKADPELIRQAWKGVGGKGQSLRRLAREAANGSAFPLLELLEQTRGMTIKAGQRSNDKPLSRARRLGVR